MKADQIIKNAKIFTANKDSLQATALVVKDGKFIYVGDEAGLSAYEGEVTDLGGKFIMPGRVHRVLQQKGSLGLYGAKHQEQSRFETSQIYSGA